MDYVVELNQALEQVPDEEKAEFVYEFEQKLNTACRLRVASDSPDSWYMSKHLAVQECLALFGLL